MPEKEPLLTSTRTRLQNELIVDRNRRIRPVCGQTTVFVIMYYCDFSNILGKSRKVNMFVQNENLVYHSSRRARETAKKLRGIKTSISIQFYFFFIFFFCFSLDLSFPWHIQINIRIWLSVTGSASNSVCVFSFFTRPRVTSRDFAYAAFCTT